MSYLVLARKFRPQTFASIAGQEYISQALANAILRNRVSHAYLFTGPRGVGKTTSARVLARALNCSGRPLPKEENIEHSLEAVEPCGECSNCIEIARGSSIAVWEIDGASNNSVDNVRELIDSLRSLPPPGSNYKIYIIDEVHMLSVAAFNALLKSLEEPPPQTIFIFATTEPHKIPETVISRCQRHDFRRITQEVIAERLNEIAALESLVIEPGVTEFIARRAQGGMRDAQSMLDRLIAFGSATIDLNTARSAFGAVDSSFFFDQSAAVIAGDVSNCFAQLDRAFNQSLDIRSFAADFLAHWRNILLCTSMREADLQNKHSGLEPDRLAELLGVSIRELANLQEQTASLASFDAQRLFELAEKSASQVLKSSFPRFVLEAGLAKMATLTSLRPLPDIINALKNASSTGTATKSTAPQLQKAPSTNNSAIDNQPTPSATKAIPQPDTVELVAVEPVSSEPVTSQHVAEPLPASEEAFNPSWEEFLTHVKSIDAVMLGAYLRRVSATKFVSGVIHLEATAFDAAALQDRAMLNQLREALNGFISVGNWDIRIAEHRATNKQAGAPAQTIAKRQRPPANKPVVDALVPGSVAERERQDKKRRAHRVESEARESDSVKSALEAFAGSSIEKISVLDEV